MTIAACSFHFSADFSDARLRRGIVLILAAAVAIMAPR
jgi:hypothetical protein